MINFLKQAGLLLIGLSLPVSTVTAQGATEQPTTLEKTVVVPPVATPMSTTPETPNKPATKRRSAIPDFSPFEPEGKNRVIASVDGTVLHVMGEFRAPLATDLKDAIASHPKAKTIALSSFGGSIIEGLAVAKIVHSKGLDTHVELMCASACTLAFLGGKSRTISKTGRLGFHQSSSALFGMAIAQEANSPGDRSVRTEMAARGVDMAFIDKVLTIPSADIWLPDHDELLKQNIVTSVIEPGAIIFSKVGTWTNAAEMERELFSSAMWRKAKQAQPKAYYQSITETWLSTTLSNGKLTPAQAARYAITLRLLKNADALPDELIGRFIKSETNIWSSKADVVNKNCKGFPFTTFPFAMPKTLVETETQDAILVALLSQPASDAEPDPERRKQADAIIIDFWAEVVATTELTGTLVERSFCTEPIHYYEALALLPPEKQIKIFRALAVQFMHRPVTKIPALAN